MIDKIEAPVLPSKYRTKVRPPYFFYVLFLLIAAGGYYFYTHQDEVLAYFNKGSLVEIDENGKVIPIDGIKKEEVTAAKDKFIYFYYNSKNILMYGFEEPGMSDTFINKYECSFNECEVFPREFNENLFPMKDGNEYFLYNHEKNIIESPRSPYKIVVRMYDDDTKEQIGFLIKHKYKFGFFTDKVTLSPNYDSVSNVKYMLDNKSSLNITDDFSNYIVDNLLVFGKTNGQNMTIDVLNSKMLFSNTSYFTKNNSDARYLLTKSVDNKTKKSVYKLFSNDGKTDYLSKFAYEKIFVRTDDDVVVVKNGKFQYENIYGKIKFTSKAYKEIFDVFENYIIVNDENKLSIVDDKDNVIASIKLLSDTEEYVNYDKVSNIYSGIHDNEIWLYFKDCNSLTGNKYIFDIITKDVKSVTDNFYNNVCLIPK